MYRDAYKCNACGFISLGSGTHCNTPMVPVVVMDNVLAQSGGGSSAPQNIIIREVVTEKGNTKPWENYK